MLAFGGKEEGSGERVPFSKDVAASSPADTFWLHGSSGRDYNSKIEGARNRCSSVVAALRASNSLRSVVLAHQFDGEPLSCAVVRARRSAECSRKSI